MVRPVKRSDVWLRWGTAVTPVLFAVVLLLSGGTLSLAVGQSLPVITAIAPASGSQNATVSATITGQHLTGATAVTFSGTGVTASIVSGTAASLQITITVAANAPVGVQTLTVTTPVGTSNVFTGFTVVFDASLL